MKHILAAVILSSLLFVPGQAKNPTTPLKVEERTFVLRDSLQLHGWLMRDTASQNQPLIILLHQLGTDHDSYQPFIDALTDYVASDAKHGPMPTIISFDLRGHGKSIIRGNDTVRVDNMPNEEFLKYPTDIKQALRELLKDKTLGVDTSRIYVVGASIGANSAAILTEISPGISKAALLSPGKSYHTVDPSGAIAKYQGKMLIYASKGDTYSAESSATFAKSNPTHCTLQIFDGDAHGTELLKSNPKAMQQLVEWVVE